MVGTIKRNKLIKKAYKKYIILFIAVILLVVFFVIWQRFISYSIESAELSNIILRDINSEDKNKKNGKPCVMAVFEGDKVSSEETPAGRIYSGIKKRASDFSLKAVELARHVYQDDEFTLGSYFQDAPKYIICHVDSPILDNIFSLGYSPIQHTKHFYVMKYHRTLTVFIVRHGETDANVRHILQGSGGDFELNENGIEQAAALGQELSNIDFNAAYTSALMRTRQTAQYILSENKYWDTRKKAVALSLLNDNSWGEAEGMVYATAVEKFGENSMNLGAIDDSDYVSPIGAETKYQAVNRFGWAMQSIVNDASKDGENILVVAHSSIAWWIQYATGVQTNLNNTDCVKLQFTDGTWTLKKY